MSKRELTPEERFADLVDELVSNPDVTPPETGPGARRRFGASGLKVHGKIFAMLWGDKLTLKLPAARVSALLESGDGERFNPRKDDRQMKEWVTLTSTYTGDWLPIAREALDFVGAQVK
ncbi:MAG TPA: TfoX/Sxy family protein [Ktedonobacterales bacterium]